MPAHLADAGALKRLLQALAAPSADAGWSEAKARAMGPGQPGRRSPRARAARCPPVAPCWRAPQNVVLALGNSGRVAEASAQLTREAPAAVAPADAARQRIHALLDEVSDAEMRDRCATTLTALDAAP